MDYLILSAYMSCALTLTGNVSWSGCQGIQVVEGDAEGHCFMVMSMPAFVSLLLKGWHNQAISLPGYKTLKLDACFSCTQPYFYLGHCR